MEQAVLTARRLGTRELRIFLAVADSRSMAKAAKVLGTSQPAVSKAIADMEHALGVRLLDRSPQGVEPTQYGRALLKCGIAVFSELNQGIREIGFLADPTTGELRIGCPDALATGMIQVVMGRLLQKHPRMTFHIETTSLYRELRDRNIELVINRVPGSVVEEDFDAEILYHDSIVVVASAKSPWMRRRKIRLAELVNEPWVMPKSDSPLWPPLVAAFHSSGLKAPRATVTVSSFHARISLLVTGRFLSVRPASTLRFQGAAPLLKALPLKLPNSEEPVAIMTLKNRTLSPLARLFIEHAREVAKPLAKRA
jgi:DNA-binding transcriptional LysR family regulator